MNLYTASTAGMMLHLIIKAVKENNDLDFDSKEYLVDKLTAAFMSIQSDITVAIQDGVAELLEGENE